MYGVTRICRCIKKAISRLSQVYIDKTFQKLTHPPKAMYTHYLRCGANTTLAQVNRKRENRIKKLYVCK